MWGLSAHPQERLYATCGDDGTVRIWSLDDWRMVESISTDCSCRALCYSPDGASLAVRSSSTTAPKREGRGVPVWLGQKGGRTLCLGGIEVFGLIPHSSFHGHFSPDCNAICRPVASESGLKAFCRGRNSVTCFFWATPYMI